MAAAIASHQPLPPLPPPSRSSSSPSRPSSRPSSRLVTPPLASPTPPVTRAPLVWRKRVPLSFAQPQHVASAYVSDTGRVITRKRDDNKQSTQTLDRRRATSAARDRIRDRTKPNTTTTNTHKKEDPTTTRTQHDRWADRERWTTAEDEADNEEKIQQEESAVKRQPSAAMAMLLAYPRPLPLPSPQPFSTLLSPSLLALTMQYWQTFHPPLTAGCWLPRHSYLHLRLLTLRCALLSSSHGHLSSRSLALLSHLDWYEDSAEQCDEDEADEKERLAASTGMRLPVFHRALLTWAMMHLGVNERTVQLEALEECIGTLYQQLSHTLADAEEKREDEEQAAGSSEKRRYLALSADDAFMLGEVAEDAKLQWQRATLEHDKRKRKTDSDADPTTAHTPQHTTASIVARLEERKESIALQQSMPPLLAGAVSVMVRRYPSGSEIRQQARITAADKASRPANSRERQMSASASLSPSSQRSVGFEAFGISAPLSLSPVKSLRHRNSTSSVSPAHNRSAGVDSRGGRAQQLSQSPPPGLSSYAVAPSLRGDMSTSFAAMSLRISPITRPQVGQKPKR